jgi:hypothetical protein
MRERTHVLMLAGVAIAAGLSLFYYKMSRLGLPLTPDAQTEVWTIESHVSFRGRGLPAKATLTLPAVGPHFGILSENFVSRGFGLNTAEVNGRREAQWAIRRARGDVSLYYRFVVYREEGLPATEPPPPFPPKPKLDEPYAGALDQLVQKARERSADIASFTKEMLREMNARPAGEEIALFGDFMETPLDRVHTAQTLLAGALIPSRVVHGMRLADDQKGAKIEPWLEVHNEATWLLFDPVTGEQHDPKDFLVWWYGDDPLLNVTNARGEKVELSVRRNVVDSIEVAERRAELHASKAYRFALFELPLQAQASYGVLLLVPIGGFVMAFLRNIIGIPTFGTFTPVLIALAFRETQLLNGLLLFTFVVILGLTVRFYFERLGLLLVPRLAAVLTVVVLLLVGIGVLSNELDIETGLSVALFPMVILTMVIERMSIVWEERGPTEAITEGLGSLAVASAAYLVMSVNEIQHLVFVFPELLLIVLAAALLLGRYKGYRLTELVRFKAFLSRS